MSEVVRISNLEVGFQKQPLLSIENLIVNSGEVLAITGPSGIGKTSLLKTVAGLLTPLSGSVQVCEATSPQKPPRGTIGYIPQKLGLVRHSSVWANVMLGSRAGNTKSDSREQSTNAILAMGLEEKRNEPIKRLSGGQQRRVAIARTLAQRPKLILADEFLSELDEETSDRVVKAVMQYVSSSGAAMVLVEHDISRAREISDRLLVIDDGRLNPFITDTSIMEVRY
ncbi:MAG: ATP-binding cassette domain-containing protein [Candidatus Poseidoniales archaeon]